MLARIICIMPIPRPWSPSPPASTASSTSKASPSAASSTASSCRPAAPYCGDADGTGHCRRRDRRPCTARSTARLDMGPLLTGGGSPRITRWAAPTDGLTAKIHAGPTPRSAGREVGPRADFSVHEHHIGARFAQQLGAVGDRNTVQGAESPDRVRTTTTGTFADCATAAPTEPSGIPANPPRP